MTRFQREVCCNCERGTLVPTSFTRKKKSTALAIFDCLTSVGCSADVGLKSLELR